MADSEARYRAPELPAAVVHIPIEAIRPEAGLGRRRDAEGHAELRRSIEAFGVLTPITVRTADGPGQEYLLVKGQGRTLACRMLGHRTIPAIVVDGTFSDADKVGQFLVENVARLKMRPVERALLVRAARASGEETASISKRFGISATAVRRFDALLRSASEAELADLAAGTTSLAMHAVLGRHCRQEDRVFVLDALRSASLSARDADQVLTALDWRGLTLLGPVARSERDALLRWLCAALSADSGSMTSRLIRAAQRFPASLDDIAANVLAS